MFSSFSCFLWINIINIFAVVVDSSILSDALTRFAYYNNGYYSFQFKKKTNLPPAFNQAMNVAVKDNEIFSISFGEGNEYALNNFCDGSQTLYDKVLNDLSLTILDIFEEIQNRIENDGWTILNASFHDAIGIPLFIIIAPSIGAENIIYTINCFEFTKKPRRSYSSITRRLFDYTYDDVDRQRAVFNKIDPNSCPNIETPSSCPIGDFICNRYSDGCNTCTCDDNGEIIGCTKILCDTEDVEDPQCLDCEGDTEWVTCAGPTDCIPTCDDNDVFCGSSSLTICNTPRCQCRSDHPLYNQDTNECLAVDECHVVPPIPPLTLLL